MHPDLFVKALGGIETETTLEKFCFASGIFSKTVAKDVLYFLSRNNIGSFTNDTIRFSTSDRLRAAMLALQMGCDVEFVSTRLRWNDFEMLASEVLASLGYRTWTNVRFTKPRMEIDVVGINSSFAIAVDCKHWNKTNISSISDFAKKQAARAQRLFKWDMTISKVVPVIMTLHTESVKFAGGVPIVSVNEFKSFVMDVMGLLPEIHMVSFD